METLDDKATHSGSRAGLALQSDLPEPVPQLLLAFGPYLTEAGLSVVEAVGELVGDQSGPRTRPIRAIALLLCPFRTS